MNKQNIGQATDPWALPVKQNKTQIMQAEKPINKTSNRVLETQVVGNSTSVDIAQLINERSKLVREAERLNGEFNGLSQVLAQMGIVVGNGTSLGRGLVSLSENLRYLSKKCANDLNDMNQFMHSRIQAAQSGSEISKIELDLLGASLEDISF